MAEEGFHDYTLATNLERLVAHVEQCFRGWMLTGLEHISHMPPAVGTDKQPTNTVRVSNNLNHRLPWREQPYILTLHVPYTREAELQAARQQQYHYQQQQQQQQQQQRRQIQQQQQQQQPPVSSTEYLPLVVEPLQPAAAAAAAGGERGAPVSVPDQASAAAAAAANLQQQQQGDSWQQVPTGDLEGASTVAGIVAGTPAAAAAGGSSEQLDQRVQDLIEEYRQLHLQLQEGETTVEHHQHQQQQGESQVGSADAVDHSQVQLQLGSNVASEITTAAAAAGSGIVVGGAAERRSQSDVSVSPAAAVVTEVATVVPRGGGTLDVSPPPPTAAAAGGGIHMSPTSSKPPKAAVPGLRKLISSSCSSTAAVGGEEASESDETDENNTRQVDLPAPDDLLLPNSSALAAAQAAVRRDQSSTAVSRTWWPHCFAAASSSSTPAAAAAAECARILPSSFTPLKPPWWAPVSSIHKLQRWFGLDLFVLLQPASFSRRFLDQAEASSLLSVGRLALSSSGVMWPLLLPAHDALRDAYCGVAQVGGSSVYFTSDSIHVSRLPRHLTASHQQISILADQLAAHNAAAAAACLAAVGQTAAGSSGSGSGQYIVSMSACCTYRLPDVSKMHWLQQQQQRQRRSSQLHSYTGSTRSSFSSDASLRNPSASHHRRPTGLRNPRFDEEDLDGIDWDADSAWHPWAQQCDPITALELDLIWEDRQICDPGHAAVRSEIQSKVSDHSMDITAGEHNHRHHQQQQRQMTVPGVVISAGSAADLLSNVSAADHWLLHVVSHGYSSPPLRQGRLGMRSANRHRRHVSLAAAGAEWLWTADLAQQVLSEGGRLSGVCPQPYNYNPGSSSSSSSSKRQVPLDPGSFTTMLSALMTARTAATAANSLWELAGVDWWESRGESAVPPLPPESVLDSVIRDLFSPPKVFGSSPVAAGSSGSSSRRSSVVGSVSNPIAAAGSGSSGDLPRSAPAGSLLCRLSLHALVFGNARAIAALWQRFVSQIRLQYWEQRALLPYMRAAEQQQQQDLARSGSSSGSLARSFSDLGRSRSEITTSGLSNVFGGPPAPDLDACLLNQKLQMLNICIWRRDKRLSRGVRLDQQQLQLSAAAAAVGVGGSSSDLIEDSSSVRDGLITAASSSFVSAAEGDDEDDDDLASAAAEVDQAEVTSQAETQQQQSSSNNFVDATSEFSSVISNFTDFNPALSQSQGQPDLQQQQQQAQQQPEGVDHVIPGEYLLNFPDQPLSVPIVQEELVFTEDQIVERQTALMHLAEASAAAAAAGAGSSSSSNRLLIASAGVAAAAAGDDAPPAAAATDAELLVLRQRLLAAPLLSDMSAFKAANPGCCLEDFLRWYSPKDWQSQQQPQDHPDQSDRLRSPLNNVLQQQQQQSDSPDHSDRLRSPQSKVSSSPAAAQQSPARSDPGSWQNLWTIAPSLPAAAQRPLLDPNKEGEQVLHYLEMITPAALFGQLLAAAVNEALELLNTSRGAALPAAATVVSRFRSMAAAVLRKGGGISEALAAAAPQQQQQHLAGDWQGAEGGLLDIELELLLAEFHYVEQVVVLGESLLCRLPGQRDLAARLLDHLVQGCGSSSSSSDLSRSESDLRSEDYATEARVLGLAGNLPVARLTSTEALGLLKWVAAAAQKTSAAAATVWKQQQQQDKRGTGLDNSQSIPAATAAQVAQDSLVPAGIATAASRSIGGNSSSSSNSNERQQIQELQLHLGEPAQWQWVTTCARSTAAAASVGSSSTSSCIKLKPSVAAAVAAAAGVGGAAAAAAAAPVPPSRMYLQEADGEMRMAFTLVSDTTV